MPMAAATTPVPSAIQAGTVNGRSLRSACTSVDGAGCAPPAAGCELCVGGGGGALVAPELPDFSALMRRFARTLPSTDRHRYCGCHTPSRRLRHATPPPLLVAVDCTELLDLVELKF